MLSRVSAYKRAKPASGRRFHQPTRRGPRRGTTPTTMTDSTSSDPTDLSKREFLSLAAGLGGAGAAGLAALAMADPAAADEPAPAGDRYLFVITKGSDDPNRAILALVLAGVVAKKKWGKVEVWMTLSGAELANKTKAAVIESAIFKTFGTAAKLMESIRASGGSFGVCPPCATFAGAAGEAKPEWVKLAGGDWLMQAIKGAHVTWL